MGPDVHPGSLTAAAAARATTPPARAARASSPRGLRERADVILAAVMFALFARTFLFQAYEVPSGSMEKSVLTGDRLLVNKFIYSERAAREGASVGRLLPARALRRGDVVVFRFPADPRRDFIKRVVALPGETVAIRDKRVFVDGEPLSEPYAFHADDAIWPDDPAIAEDHRLRDQLPAIRVPEGTYFVLGDNRDDSNDSRFWGPVPDSLIEGRALFVYWSVTPRSSVAPPARGVPLASPVDLLRRTRWDRAFLPVR
jgi:signal peptidase I